MHKYLRSIGFSSIKTRTEFDRLLEFIMEQDNSKQVIDIDQNISFTEIRWMISESMGICLRGEIDEGGRFHLEHYFPYLESNIISTTDHILISHRVDTEALIGMCDDYRLGVSLIFYIQNIVDYMKKSKVFSVLRRGVAGVLVVFLLVLRS